MISVRQSEVFNKDKTKLNRSLLVDLQKRNIDFDLQKFDDFVKQSSDKHPRPGSSNRYNMDQMSTATSFMKNNQSVNMGQNAQQQQLKEEEEEEEELNLDIEQMIIETNHNEINTFNYEKPMIEEITVESLEKYTERQEEEFENVRKLTLKFDANADSLQLVGDLFCNLTELKLNNSIVPSLRDLGTSLQNLKILWVNRVGLEDLSGISSLLNLTEFYANYNNVTSLLPLDFNDKIEILDLEGNDIEEMTNIDYLETMSNLKDLNLSGNPVALQREYRENIGKKLKGLEILDEEEMQGGEDLYKVERDIKDQINVLENESRANFYEIYQQVKIKNSSILDNETKNKLEIQMQNDPNEEYILLQSVKKASKKVSDKKDIFMTEFDKKKVQNDIQQDQTSQLTEGMAQSFSGNPFKALKMNKKKGNNNSTAQSMLTALPEEFLKLMENFEQKTDNQGMKELKRELNMNPEYGMNTPLITKKDAKKRPQSSDIACRPSTSDPSKQQQQQPSWKIFSKGMQVFDDQDIIGNSQTKDLKELKEKSRIGLKQHSFKGGVSGSQYDQKKANLDNIFTLKKSGSSVMHDQQQPQHFQRKVVKMPSEVLGELKDLKGKNVSTKISNLPLRQRVGSSNLQNKQDSSIKMPIKFKLNKELGSKGDFKSSSNGFGLQGGNKPGLPKFLGEKKAFPLKAKRPIAKTQQLTSEFQQQQQQ